jgi:hypothetical protein
MLHKFIITAACIAAIGALTALLETLPAEADLLVGINDTRQPRDGLPNEIVRFDLGTGVATCMHTFPAFSDLESLCYDARSDAMWSTNSGILVRIDPRTFFAVPIGETGVQDIDGMAIEPVTGTLFGITYGGNDLITIDKNTAHATVVNSHVEEGSRLEDLAFDSTGHLYVISSNSLVELRPSDGVRISKVSLSGAPSLESLVWWSTGGTFLTAGDRGTTKDLMRLDRSTGVATFVGAAQPSGCADIDALAFVPSTPPILAVEPRTWGATKALYR